MTAVVSKNISTGSSTPMISNSVPRIAIRSPGALSNFRARSAPSITTRPPSSATVISRPWAISHRKVSRPWSAPAVNATRKSGALKPGVPVASGSSMKCTRGAAAATPGTAPTSSTMPTGMGTYPNPKAGLVASLTRILSSKYVEPPSTSAVSLLAMALMTMSAQMPTVMPSTVSVVRSFLRMRLRSTCHALRKGSRSGRPAPQDGAKAGVVREDGQAPSIQCTSQFGHGARGGTAAAAREGNLDSSGPAWRQRAIAFPRMGFVHSPMEV